MAKLKKQSGDDFERVCFECPGCGDYHSIPVTGPHAWQWNRSLDSPTFNPSILARDGHYIPGHTGPCWCTYNQEHPDDPAPFKCGICHSFVTDGRIQFLDDCTHELKGKTVDLREVSE